MNKKKLAILFLVVVMILSLALTALVGCKGKNNDNKGGNDDPDDPEEIVLSSALTDVVDNTVRGNLLNNLAASAQLSLKTTYGDTEKELLVKFAGNIALDTKDDNATTFSFSIQDAKAKSNILHVYYLEYLTTENSAASGDIYVVVGAGDNQKRYLINAMSVKETLTRFFKTETDEETGDKKDVLDEDGNKVDCGVTKEDAEEISETITDKLTDIYGYLEMIGGLGDVVQTESKDLKVSVDVAEVINGLSSLLAVIDEYTVPLGLNLTAANIASVLPGLTIDLTFKLNGAEVNNFEDATLAGIEAEIGVKNKDMKIERTGDPKTTFVEINIAKDFKLGLGLDFKFGEDADEASGFDDNWYEADGVTSTYTIVNALNFVVDGELKLNEALGVNVTLGTFALEIAIPKDTYDIQLSLEADPFKLVDLVDATIDFKNDIVGSIKSLAGLRAIKFFGVKITPQSADNTKALELYLYERAVNNGGQISYTWYVSVPNVSLLGSLGDTITSLLGNGQYSLDYVLEKLGPMFGLGDSTNASSALTQTDAETDEDAEAAAKKKKTEETLALIKTIIEKLTILVNQASNPNVVDVTLEEYVVAQNAKVDADNNPIQAKDDKGELVWKKNDKGEFELNDKGEKIPVYEIDPNRNTTLSADVALNKNDGLKINATLKGMYIDYIDCGSLNAQISAKDGVVEIAVKAPDLVLDHGSIPMNIDLVLKITGFSFGKVNDVKPSYAK